MDNIAIANANYMARRAMESTWLPFIFPPECAIAIEAVALKSGKWYADRLAGAFVAYGSQGENANIRISDPYAGPNADFFANYLFWDLHRIIADSQAANFFHIDHNQMMLVEEYVDAYRKHLENRRIDPSCEQCLPFVFHGSYVEKLSTLHYAEQQVQALRDIIGFGVQGIEPVSYPLNPEIDDVVSKICARIRHEQEELMDFIQREKEEESLFTEFIDESSAEADPEKELEKFSAFLERIYDPKHKSKFNRFPFYEDYAYAVYDLVGQTSRRRLLYAIMRYGTEGVKGLYEISDPEVKLPFIQIKASIKASQKRYRKAQIDGKKGGRPEKFPRKLFIELAKRGFSSAGEIAPYLECSVRTVERKISDDEIWDILESRHNRYRGHRRNDTVISPNPEEDPNVIPLLINTGVKKFQYLKDEMEQSKKEDL